MDEKKVSEPEEERWTEEDEKKMSGLEKKGPDNWTDEERESYADVRSKWISKTEKELKEKPREEWTEEDYGKHAYIENGWADEDFYNDTKPRKPDSNYAKLCRMVEKLDSPESPEGNSGPQFGA